jgi:hypothetical protein
MKKTSPHFKDSPELDVSDDREAESDDQIGAKDAAEHSGERSELESGLPDFFLG